MNRLFRFWLVTWVVALTACGGGGSNENPPTPVPDYSTIDMLLNQTYPVLEGYSIELTSPPAEVEVSVNTETGKTELVFLSGSANLLIPEN